MPRRRRRRHSDDYDEPPQTVVHVHQPNRGTSGLAIASVIFGILGLVLFCIPFVGIGFSCLGMVCGFGALLTRSPGVGLLGLLISLASFVLLFFGLLGLLGGSARMDIIAPKHTEERQELKSTAIEGRP